jgi:hypothetical protein
MTEENPDNKIEDDKEAEEKKAPGAPAAVPFVAPPYRERVHSRRLQQPQPSAQSDPQSDPQADVASVAAAQAPAVSPEPAAEAPGQSTTGPLASAPDMSMYLSRRSFGSASGQFPTVAAPQQNFAPDASPDLSSNQSAAQSPTESFAPDSAPVETFSPSAAPSAPEWPSDPVPQQDLQAEPLPLNQFIVDESAPLIDPREAAYIEAQELALQRPAEPEEPVKPPCRHEYVRIFQRKLKDLNRRMVCTKAYLPVGFKMGDFQHLGENSFCFCATCRARLYPKRSQAEKAEARIQLAQGKALKLEQQSLLSADLIEEVGASALKKLLMHVDDNEDDEVEDVDDVDDENTPKVDIHVEEMEQEAIGVEDLDVEGLPSNQEEDTSEMSEQEEL